MLWSGAGGQLLSSDCCGQRLVVSHCHHIAVVRGWWSAIVIMLLWSGVGGQLRTRSLEGPFRGAFGKTHHNCETFNQLITSLTRRHLL